MISKLMTVAEAAQLKGVSRTSIYNAVKDGRLKSQLVLGHVALSRRDVERWQPSATPGWPKGKRVKRLPRRGFPIVRKRGGRSVRLSVQERSARLWIKGHFKV